MAKGHLKHGPDLKYFWHHFSRMSVFQLHFNNMRAFFSCVCLSKKRPDRRTSDLRGNRLDILGSGCPCHFHEGARAGIVVGLAAVVRASF
jgi:hypothetical protein